MRPVTGRYRESTLQDDTVVRNEAITSAVGYAKAPIHGPAAS
ncbi:hypothetical protein [Paeniglutamicibacter quisquiliarum]|nr:hypothetical protein [Paeniglutamicibacter quisquiliarum]